MTQTALILGASGKLGHHAASAFQAAGWQARKYDRHAGNMKSAAQGADVIVNGLNPPNYHNWAQLIPEITTEVIAAARATGATVIVPGNVYNFGDTPGVWDENTPQDPCSRKGQIRKEMEAAYRASGVRTIILRAGNFIDPERDDDVMSLLYLRSLAKGKVTSPGDPDVMQAACYLPDWARAAVLLAEMRNELATFEDIPFPGHAFTANQLRETLEGMLGQPLRIARFPWWMITALSPMVEVFRELREMHYLWNTPHQLSDAKFNRLLPGFAHTPLVGALAASLPADVHPDQRMAQQRAAVSG